MDIGFVLVADKKFGFSVRNQRNLSFFFGISLVSDGKNVLFLFFGMPVVFYATLVATSAISNLSGSFTPRFLG